MQTLFQTSIHFLLFLAFTLKKETLCLCGKVFLHFYGLLRISLIFEVDSICLQNFILHCFNLSFTSLTNLAFGAFVLSSTDETFLGIEIG